MIKTLLVLFISSLCSISHAQELPPYDDIVLGVKADYDSVANDAALQAANYLLSVPVDRKNLSWLGSVQYIMRWTAGTPDYYFIIDEQCVRMAKNNANFIALFLGASTKFVLENKDKSKNEKKIKYASIKMIIDYMKQHKNSLKTSTELKKAIQAEEKGELEKFLATD